jgi:hypothetical protein
MVWSINKSIHQTKPPSRDTNTCDSINEIFAVVIKTGYELDGRDSFLSRGTRFLCIPQRPDRHWDPPILLYSGRWGLISLGVKRTSGEADRSLSLIAEVNSCGALLPLPNTFSWVMLNYLSTGKICQLFALFTSEKHWFYMYNFYDINLPYIYIYICSSVCIDRPMQGMKKALRLISASKKET